MSPSRSRILDASAVVALFYGHPNLLKVLDEADVGDVSIAIPTNVILEAQALLRSSQSVWDSVLALGGVCDLPLSAPAAREAGDFARPRMEAELPYRIMIGPPMVGQVLREALTMNGIIVTSVPEAYRGHEVAIAVF